MMAAGVGSGLNRTIRIAGDQMRNPEEDLMTSILRGYGVRTNPLKDPGVADAASAEAAGGGGKGLLATLKSL